MKIRIHKGFRAVLSVLVTVMLLVGVMPLSAVQVHAADLIVYFAPEIYKGSDYFSGAPYIYAWGGTYSAGRQIMTLVPNSETTYGHKIYMYNFGSTNPSGATIIPSSTGWNNQTENITPQNGYVYYITKQNSNNKLDYASVSSLSEACKATIYFSKNMGTYRLHTDDAFINIWDGDTKVIKKVKMDWFGTIQGFYVYTTYALLGNTISFEDSNGNDTETTADIHDNYLYYVKLSYSKYEVFGFPYSHLNLAYLSSSDTFSATKDMNVIVDAAGTATFKQNSELNYVNATLYDYFSDYEIIEGIPRSGGMKGGVAQTGITAATMSDSWEDPYKRMPLLTFDKALSDFYGDGYSHHLYFGDIHEEQDGYSFGMYNNNHWNLKYENSTSGLTYKIGNNSYYNQYQQLYHDNNSTRRSGLNVTDQSPSAFSTAMGLYAQTLGTYTAKPTEGETQAQKETRMNNNAKRLKLVGGANAKWFDSDWIEQGLGTAASPKSIGASYNVDFPFWTIEGLSRTIKIGSNTYTRTGDYYYINSENASHALRLHKDTSGQYYLKETGEGVYNFSGNDTDVINAAENVGKTDEQLLALINTTYGFFPFNSKQDFYTGGNTSTIRNLMDYKLRFDRTNYCFGTYMEIPFTLTNNNGTVDGRTLADGGTPITFTFSGDDDLLVYIDGQLVLDIGGNHGKVQGEINLQQKKSWVSQAKTSNGSGEATGVTWAKGSGDVTANVQNITIPSSITNNNGVKILADALCAKGEHIMEIF